MRICHKKTETSGVCCRTFHVLQKTLLFLTVESFSVWRFFFVWINIFMPFFGGVHSRQVVCDECPRKWGVFNSIPGLSS